MHDGLTARQERDPHPEWIRVDAAFDPLTASAVGLNLAPALQRNLALETAGWRGLTRRMMAR
jgi:hypothetical protein